MVTRRWDKTSDNTFSFFVNDEEVGKIQKTFKTSGITAHFSIRKDNFTIKRTGFWKSVVEVFDAKGQIIAKVQTTNWFSSSFILEYNDEKYSLVVRNNPLAECVILKDGKELLSYGI